MTLVWDFFTCNLTHDPMDCSPPGSSVHGILQARTLKWVAMPSSRGIFLTQGSNLGLLHYRQTFFFLLFLFFLSFFFLLSEPPGRP